MIIDKSGMTQAPEDIPPPYAQGPIASTSAPASAPTTNVPAIARCNHLEISRKDYSIKGTFVIDTDMDVPESMLAPLKEGEERKNLKLHSIKESLDVDVWVISSLNNPVGDGKAKRTTLEFQCKEKLSVKLHAEEGRPFTATFVTSEGATIQIPQGFRGPLTIYSKEQSVKLSKTLEPLVATFSDVDGIRKCFVGDFSQSGFGSGEWLGSSIDIKAKGRVNLAFVEEVEAVTTKQWSLFGGLISGQVTKTPGEDTDVQVHIGQRKESPSPRQSETGDDAV